MTEHDGLIKHGYAPGNYENKCGQCDKHFHGDKHAITCIYCASIKTIESLPEYKECQTKIAELQSVVDRLRNPDVCSFWNESSDSAPKEVHYDASIELDRRIEYAKKNSGSGVDTDNKTMKHHITQAHMAGQYNEGDGVDPSYSNALNYFIEYAKKQSGDRQ